MIHSTLAVFKVQGKQQIKCRVTFLIGYSTTIMIIMMVVDGLKRMEMSLNGTRCLGRADSDGNGRVQSGSFGDVESSLRLGDSAGRGTADAGARQPGTASQRRRSTPQQARRRRRLGCTARRADRT